MTTEKENFYVKYIKDILSDRYKPVKSIVFELNTQEEPKDLGEYNSLLQPHLYGGREYYYRIMRHQMICKVIFEDGLRFGVCINPENYLSEARRYEHGITSGFYCGSLVMKKEMTIDVEKTLSAILNAIQNSNTELRRSPHPVTEGGQLM